MRSNKIIIYALSLCLVMLGVLAASFREMPEEQLTVSLFFRIDSGQNAEMVAGWEDDQNTVYVFLPGYAELSDVWFQTGGDKQFLIDGTEISDGDSCDAYTTDKVYELTMKSGSSSVQKNLVFVQSGHFPTMYIDVQSGSMDYIHMDMSNQDSGSIRLYDDQGETLYSGALDTIKGRGNTSWYADKKPYNITLSQETDLLGMGTAQKWILLSEGYNTVNIRNKIVYDFAKRIGCSYTPDCRWIDLYLNGEYAGVYLLTERNEVHPQRVDLTEEGSFLVSMEDIRDMERKNVPYIDLGTSQVLRVRYSAINNQMLMKTFETLRNALVSPDGRDPSTGKHWQELIDTDSWVRKYLIEELFANQDGGAVSQFFYMDGSDPQKRICAGPVWDYDFAMGGEDLWLWNYDAFLTMAREYTDDEMYLPWFYELYRKDLFYNRLTELYETEFLPLVNQLIEKDLDRYKNEVLDSARTDGIRWGHSEKAILADISFIGEFLENRISFLSDMWIEGTQYHIVQVSPGRYLSGYFAVKDGELLPSLPAAEDLGGLGWYLADSDIPFDISQPIYEDMHLYMKQPESSLPTIHFAPLIGLIAFLTGLAAWNMYWDKKNRRQNHDTAKTA